MNRTTNDHSIILDRSVNRRGFLATSVSVGTGILVAGSARAQTQSEANSSATANPNQPAEVARKKFKLKYAPTFGMFEGHAGKDPIAQLRFKAEAGFSALLDGGFLGRPHELQDKLAKEMERLGMTLGGPYCSTTIGGQSLVAGTDQQEGYCGQRDGLSRLRCRLLGADGQPWPREYRMSISAVNATWPSVLQAT